MRDIVVLCMASVSTLFIGLPALAQAQNSNPKAEKIVCALVDCEVAAPDTATTPTADADEDERTIPAIRGAGLDWTSPGVEVAAASRSYSPPKVKFNPAAKPRRLPPPAGHKELEVAFELGKATLTPEGTAGARDFLDALRDPRLKGKRFLIAGHTDSSGSRPGNLRLSEARARTVANFLIHEGGVDPFILKVRGYGPDAPLPDRRASDPANRRVEVRLL